MKTIDFVTSLGRGEKAEASVTLKFKTPETLAEAVKTYGEAVVFDTFLAQLIVDVQGLTRSRMKATLHPTKEGTKPGKIDDAWKTKMQSDIDAWKPGTRAPAVSKVEKANKLLDGLSPEERAALIAKYSGSKKAA